MAGTKITLTLIPEEYDFVKRAVTAYTANANATAKDPDTDSKLRREAQIEHVKGADLLRNI